MNNDIQVASSHYYNDYDTVERFLSYHHQIELARG